MRIPAARLLPRIGALAPRLPRLPRAMRMHWRRRLVALAIVAAALSLLYFAWFRHSSFVRVERVTVDGLSTTPDAPQVRSRLIAAAKGMSTLDLDPGALHGIVADTPVIRTLELRPDFPHGLVIHVVENRPVALLSAGGSTVPVAADGTLLEGVEVHGRLPTLETPSLPDGTRMPRGGALDRVTVAGAAPRALLRRVESITIQPDKGFVVQLEDGPAIWLGGNWRLEYKWAAAAAVLAQESSQGASYIDVRIPDRPVAGGLDVTNEPQADPDAPADVPTPDSTATASQATTPQTTTDPATGQPATAAPVTTAPVTPTTAEPVTPATGATAPTTTTNPQP